MTNPISEERLRNTRAWAAARVGSLSGADVIVGAIDELIALRESFAARMAMVDTPVEPEAPRAERPEYDGSEDLCIVKGCTELACKDSFVCWEHRVKPENRSSP